MTQVGEDLGWYLYGIAPNNGGGEAERAMQPGLDGSAPVRAIPLDRLVAIASPISLAELGPSAIRARSGDLDWIETMVRGHARVVEAVHRQRGILPAKFGTVFPNAAALVATLEQDKTRFGAQLDRLACCDEWGIRLGIDPSMLRTRLASADSSLQELEHELETAGPGKSYLLRRRWEALLATSLERALGELAASCFECLARHSAAQVQTVLSLRGAPGSDGEVELLRAAFLVQRDQAPAFHATAARLPQKEQALTCACSGPWPPYSFAAPETEQPR